MDVSKQVPIIYNLFPRLAGPLPDWLPHAARAVDMGFNWIYVNSIHYPGFSGSLYAVKYYRRLNPMFMPPGAAGRGLLDLRRTLHRLRDLGLRPMIDLVINHTSRDCPLAAGRPDWYLRDGQGNLRSPFARDPDDPEKVTVWGDLAEIDNAGSADREGLWAYWAGVVRTYLELGVKGFRCDAAYKVPAELWRRLVHEAAGIDPEAVFFAETLGCTEAEALALGGTGLHYFFNSSKWWDFEKSWCLEQHERFGKIAPSISFPETHDTTRLAADTGGSEAVQRQRYAFAATFSAGLMMPIGYEFGFRKKLDVVATGPADWETPAFDLSGFLKRVNGLKAELPLLQGEGDFRPVRNSPYVLILERRTERAPGQVAWVLVNRSRDRPAPVILNALTGAGTGSHHQWHRLCRDENGPETRPAGETVVLDPAEVVLVTAPEAK